MAKLKPLANITTMRDMRNYTLAEASDASSKCPAAYSDYQKALQILDTYSTFEGTALEITYVELARQAVLEARKTWYAVGCSDPNVVSPEPAGMETAPPIPVGPDGLPSHEPIHGALGGGSLGKFLLVGGALAAAMFLFGKKKRTAKRGALHRRRTVRRRRHR